MSEAPFVPIGIPTICCLQIAHICGNEMYKVEKSKEDTFVPENHESYVVATFL